MESGTIKELKFLKFESGLDMKAVILAGGLGTRLAEETTIRPKPMIEIGGEPILLHIMKIFSNFGVNEFIICLGYKGYYIKEYFANYATHKLDVEFDFKTRCTNYISSEGLPNWNVKLIDTGDLSMTGGRLKRVAKYLDPNEPFFMTYGDGVSDINISELLRFHQSHGLLATLTAVRPSGRFGATEIDGIMVKNFYEKPAGDGGQVNGGFFVLSPKVLDLIEDDSTVWEKEPLEQLAAQSQLAAYQHDGFWQPMDTLRDKQYLDDLCIKNQAPWRK